MNESRARELLLQERNEVAVLLRNTEQAEKADQGTDDGPGDEVDAALPLTATASDQAIAADLRDRLAAIDRALGRLEVGTYGRSVLSGQLIPDERMEADPAAELTVEEARDQEA